MTSWKPILAAAALAMMLPGAALAVRAWNGLEVIPLTDRSFEVVGRVGAGPSDYWCGAGDFARRYLRTPVTARIYLSRPIGPSVARPGRNAVHFSLDAPEGVSTRTGLTLDLKATGDNLSASFASNYCYDRFERDEWWIR